MEPVTVLDNEFITMQYLPDHKCIYHVIHKPIPDQPFRDALDAGTKALKQYEIHKWFSDDRSNGPLSTTFLEWSAKDWQPRTIAAGWKYWANIVPQQLVAAGTLNPVMEAVFAMGLVLQVFSNENEGWEWIDSKQG